MPRRSRASTTRASRIASPPSRPSLEDRAGHRERGSRRTSRSSSSSRTARSSPGPSRTGTANARPTLGSASSRSTSREPRAAAGIGRAAVQGSDRRVRAPRPVEARQPRLPRERGEPRALPLTRLPRGRRLPPPREARRRVARRRHRRAIARRRRLALSRPLGSLVDLDDDERALRAAARGTAGTSRTGARARARRARRRAHGRAAAPTRAATSRRRSGR